MVKFLEAFKQQLHDFVENGHNKPIHLQQNQLINSIYEAIDGKKRVLLTANQKIYKGFINRYDKDQQCLFIQEEKLITRIALIDIKRLKILG